MLDEYFTLVRESWQKTHGEKALLWQGYGLAAFVFSVAVLLPIAALLIYFNFSFSQPLFSGFSNAVLTITLLTVITIIGILYSMFLFAAIPYLSLRYLRNDPLTFSLAARKALVHKWSLFINWFLFAAIYGFIYRFLKSGFACDQCTLIVACLFTILHMILAFAILEVLDKNESAFTAFINAWQFFFKNILFCLLVAIWLLCLSIFSVVTLFVGSIWAVPAKYNAIALLYDRVRSSC
ncbi:MAG: hypothetical protein K0S08_450 [Gammaproteobacteria bacterium]|nr:hypothetical protein [Gammaproteobacteria bacterium]